MQNEEFDLGAYLCQMLTEWDGIHLLTITKSIYEKMTAIGEMLQTEAPELLSKELTELEKLAFLKLGLNYKDEDVQELYYDFLFSGMTAEEFYTHAKGVKNNEK